MYNNVGIAVKVLADVHVGFTVEVLADVGITVSILIRFTAYLYQ